MQYKQTLLRLLLFVLPTSAFSQTTYLPLGSRENILLERLEIKAGKDSILNFSKTKPYSRRQFITRLAEIDSAQALSRVDAYNTRMALVKNLEWAKGDKSQYASKKPIWKHFYKTPATLYGFRYPNSK